MARSREVARALASVVEDVNVVVEGREMLVEWVKRAEKKAQL